MRLQTEVLVAGEGQGALLCLTAPLSFWGGVDPETSTITLAGHPQHGLFVREKMLVIPELIGSSSSSAVLLELIRRGIAPAGLVLGARDAILPIGAVVALEMGWVAPSVVVLAQPLLGTGQTARLDRAGRLTVLDQGQGL